MAAPAHAQEPKAEGAPERVPSSSPNQVVLQQEAKLEHKSVYWNISLFRLDSRRARMPCSKLNRAKDRAHRTGMTEVEPLYNVEVRGMQHYKLEVAKPVPIHKVRMVPQHRLQIDAEAAYYARTGAEAVYYARTDAEAVYYTQTDAEAVYYARTDAEAVYYTQTDAEAVYYTQIDAEAAYYAQTDAKAVYYTQTDAEAVYYTRTDAEAVYWT
ncbi:hypothetical protein NDU88_010252 [Pleurodeles waltl]|uniref:Uncharacterized protein n=1 Tax=Pleurodeles waltl TaxID=8319 RepID=A0AAV7PUD0_PLEWA|nr:hypothetical protein NDU88_010252 [Pleurodeles waltl]